ncbi:Holliday junction branch migration protein RuvA [bacterium]|nr:Holliday junction branch migration protein RuvA [bacterium]
MIDRIEGRIVELEPTHVVLSVGGVGFFLSISLQTYEKIGRRDKVLLHTYLHVREDILQLFGFVDKEERAAFKILISISGVGPRVAQAILSSLSVATLRDAVAAGDWKRLTAAPGVGKKLAERMAVELRDRLGGTEAAETATGEGPAGYAGVAGSIHDAVQALVALGHNPGSAEKLATQAAKKAGEGANVQELIKIALKG